MATPLIPAIVVLVVLAAGFAASPLSVAPRVVPQTGSPADRMRVAHRRVPVAPIATTGAATVSIALVGLVPTSALVVAIWAWRPLATILASRRLARRRERELPDAIELLVLIVHAGLTPNQAVRELASTGPPSIRPAFGAVVHRLERGSSLADALHPLNTELGPSSAPLVDAIGGAERHGMPLGPVLERLADEARATRRRLGEADARRLPVKLSFPLVACTLPSFVLLAIAPSVLAAVSSLGDSTW